jgi:hypothetical protein
MEPSVANTPPQLTRLQRLLAWSVYLPVQLLVSVSALVVGPYAILITFFHPRTLISTILGVLALNLPMVVLASTIASARLVNQERKANGSLPSTLAQLIYKYLLAVVVCIQVALFAIAAAFFILSLVQHNVLPALLAAAVGLLFGLVKLGLGALSAKVGANIGDELYKRVKRYLTEQPQQGSDHP